MASTKEKKKQSKQVQKKLDQFDHVRLEKLPVEVDKARLLMATEEQALRNMLLEFELLKIKIEKHKSIVAQLAVSYENKKKEYGLIRSEIFSKYSITDEKLAYNNETGEIV